MNVFESIIYEIFLALGSFFNCFSFKIFLLQHYFFLYARKHNCLDETFENTEAVSMGTLGIKQFPVVVIPIRNWDMSLESYSLSYTSSLLRPMVSWESLHW